MAGRIIEVRSVQSDAEARTLNRLAIEIFHPEADVEAALPRRMQSMAARPDLSGEGVRAAFMGDELVGGYTMMDRSLCAGPARLRTGCIGAVLTRPEFRKQAIGTAMMQDAVEYACRTGFALLLLDGISNFYQRFGFASVHEVTELAVSCHDALALPDSAYLVRPARRDEAPALLDLYRRAWGGFVGRFDRTEADMVFRLEHGGPWSQYLVAVDPKGSIRGYAYLHPHSPQTLTEVGADDWPAQLALLQYQARLVLTPDGAGTLRWLLPPESALTYELAERLRLSAVVRYDPRGGWMARPASLDALAHSMAPAWSEALPRALPGWQGPLHLAIGRSTYRLQAGPDGVRVGSFAAGEPMEAEYVRLTPQVFTQLCLGYRSAAWAARQPDQSIPAGALPVMEALFPRRPIWIAGSDFF